MPRRVAGADARALPHRGFPAALRRDDGVEPAAGEHVGADPSLGGGGPERHPGRRLRPGRRRGPGPHLHRLRAGAQTPRPRRAPHRHGMEPAGVDEGEPLHQGHLQRGDQRGELRRDQQGGRAGADDRQPGGPAVLPALCGVGRRVRPAARRGGRAVLRREPGQRGDVHADLRELRVDRRRLCHREHDGAPSARRGGVRRREAVRARDHDRPQLGADPRQRALYRCAV